MGDKPTYRDLEKRIKEMKGTAVKTKRARNAAEESEAIYKSAFENAGTATVIIEEDATISRVNPEFVKLSGYPREEIEGTMKWTDFVVFGDLERMKGFHQKRREDEQVSPSEYEFGFVDREGNVRTIYNKVCIIPETKKSVASLLDITEHKKAEEALKESEEKFRNLVEEINEVLYITDENGMIVYINPAIKSISGYDPAEIIGRPFTHFIYEEDLPHIEELFHRVLYEGHVGKNEYRVVTKSGEMRWVSSSSRPGSVGSFPPGLVGMLTDITDRKLAEEERDKLQEQLIQSQRMESIGRLAGGVAHDFNNFLTTIMGNTDIALSGLSKDDSLYEVMEQIRGAGKSASQLTRQLLAFSRKQILQPEVIDLNQLVPQMDKMLRRLIGEDIDLVTTLGSDLGRIEADPVQMEQIIMNLAVNARDAMPEGGKLTIETANMDLDEAYSETHGRMVTPGPYVMLAVSDTGTGMSPEVRAQVFDPFFTTKEKGKGTGLGLSTVYGIVNQSKGFIWIYSEPGKGSSFKVYLPRIEKEIRTYERREAKTADLQGSETVLVIEDHEAVRQVTSKILDRYGYKALIARDGEEALQILESRKGEIHVVLTDVVMPGMSGKETAELLKNLDPEIKVIYMSGYTDNAIVHHGILDKDVTFVQKPFTPEELTEKIREVLDHQ